MSSYVCMCPRHRPSTLAEIAPRLARAQDLLRAEHALASARRLVYLRMRAHGRAVSAGGDAVEENAAWDRALLLCVRAYERLRALERTA